MRDHAGGQTLTQLREHGGIILELGTARACKHDQARMVRSRIGYDGSAVLDAVDRNDRVVDFGKLDPVSAQFHLVVDAAQKGQSAIRSDPPKISGAIGAKSGEGILYEAFGREPPVADIAMSQYRTADPDLAGFAFRDRTGGRWVADQQFRLGNRYADIRQLARIAIDRGDGRADRGLCRAIMVVDAFGGAGGEDLVGDVAGQRLSAAVDDLDAVGNGACPCQLSERGRHALQQCRLLIRGEGFEGVVFQKDCPS